MFDEFAEVGRYGAAARFDPKAQKETNFTTAGVLFWSDGYLQGLDSIAHNIRKMLNFEQYKNMDIVQAILDNNKNQMFVREWKLDMPIRFVLTKNNKAFK